MIMGGRWISIRLNIFYLNQIKNLVAAVVAVVPIIHQTKKKLLSGMNTTKHSGISNAVGLQSWVIRFFTYLILIIYNYILCKV